MMNYTTQNIAQAITDKIIADLEQCQKNGNLPKWVKPWKGSSTTGQPYNPVTKNHYSGINWLWLSVLAGEGDYGTSSEWVTYKQAQQLTGEDYPIEKGAKSVQVLFYKPLVVDAKNASGEVIKNADGTTAKTNIPMAKIYRVFNIDRVKESEKWKRPAVPEIDADNTTTNARREDLEDWIAKTKATIHHGGDRAFYAPSVDSITMPKIEDFNSTAEYYATLTHELTHWSGANHRLNRKQSTAYTKMEDTQQAYAFEELVAELGSAMLNGSLGIEGKLQHVEYIGSWIQCLKNDNKAIMKASAFAQKATTYIQGIVQTEGETAKA